MELCLISRQLNSNSKGVNDCILNRSLHLVQWDNWDHAQREGVDFKICISSFACSGVTPVEPFGYGILWAIGFLWKNFIVLIICKNFPGHIYNSLITIPRTFTHTYHSYNTSVYTTLLLQIISLSHIDFHHSFPKRAVLHFNEIRLWYTENGILHTSVNKQTVLKTNMRVSYFALGYQYS